MGNSPNIIDINNDNFQSEVLDASQDQLIMLDFWATWCGPCQSLMPIVSKLAEEYNGTLRLAKVDIDQNRQLADQFAVRSVPTVKFIKQGRVVDEFSGALPESEVRKIIDKHIIRVSDTLLDAAITQYETGETDAAIHAIQSISQQDPHNPRLPLVYAELMIREGKHDTAREVLQSLPPATRQSDQVITLLSKIELAADAADLPAENELLARIAANSKDSQARYQLGTLYTTRSNYAAALDQFLELLKYDRKFEDDAPRKAMLRIFDLLGDDPLVHTYRRKMMASMY